MKTAYLDIETSPALSYHFGMRNIFISPAQVQQRTRVICFAVRWEGESKTRFYAEWLGHDIAVELFKVYDQADVVVHYNGKRFDTPHARREIAEHEPPLGVPSPFLEVDLWQETKGRFAFMTTKLQSLAEELIQSTKIKHTGIDLWMAVLAGDKAAQRLMRRYNIQDVDLMVQLYPLLLPWIKVPNRNLIEGIDATMTCPRCGGTMKKDGKVVLTTGVYQGYRCTEDGGWARGTTRIQAAGVVSVQ